MVEALTRVATEQSRTEQNAADTSMDASITSPDVPQPKKEKKGRTPKKQKLGVAASVMGGDPSDGQPVNPDIYSAIHVYQRAGETTGKARWNASHEREMHGPNTLVFAHDHQFGQPCSSSCKVKVEGE